MTISEARRIALLSQGFGKARRTRPKLADLHELVRKLGLIQLDCVNVVVPAHYHVPFSRLGAYRRELLDELVYERRHCMEHWAHEASIIPVETYPLLRYRREGHRVWPFGFETFLEQNVSYVEEVVELVRQRGPLVAADLPDPPGASRRLENSWYGSAPRAVLEALFGNGRLAIGDRRAGFARAYDIPERVVPAEHLKADVEECEARRMLLEQAARAHGVATMGDLADYFRMKVNDAREAVGELVAAGVLERVEVEGWREAAYLHCDAPAPQRVKAATMLSPFDPLIWTRKRTLRLFDFDYRFEIFVPQEKRRWGAYVLPFLHGERLAARVDCKADRETGTLTARNVYLESWADPEVTIPALAQALGRFAQWLGLQPDSSACASATRVSKEDAATPVDD
ncbi:MAG: YcaQ family DNA glycosylase [Acidobacteria bacterium]|nr:YcaQ family DNA glycosylase [Acidobacteriota bacterium]